MLIDYCPALMLWPQINAMCLFGKVDAYFFKWETSGRGAIHAHGEVWLPDLHPRRLRRLLTDDSTRTLITRFMESLCVMVAPGTSPIESDLHTSLNPPGIQAQAGFFRPQLPE